MDDFHKEIFGSYRYKKLHEIKNNISSKNQKRSIKFKSNHSEKMLLPYIKMMFVSMYS